MSSADKDGDCEPDILEDTNGDGIFDAGDYSDPTNPDTDGDGILDGCEDVNNNGIVDRFPAELDPRNPDTDGDGVPDGLEDANHNGVYDPSAGETDGTNPDTDGDGFTDGQEDRNHNCVWDCPENPGGAPCELNPRTADTDGDGLSDSVEMRSATDPTFYLWTGSGGTLITTPPDALCNAPGAVRFLGKDGKASTDDDQTCPWNADSDGDGIADGKEDRNADGRVSTGEEDPRKVDTDGDGLPDNIEDTNLDGLYDPLTETDPSRIDTDGDGLPDGIEDSGGCLTTTITSCANALSGDGTTCYVCSGEPATGDLACNCAFWHDGIRQPIESDPRLPDTDADGLRDGVEDQNADGIWERPIPYDVPRASDETSATHVDSDGDGLSDGAEDINGNGQIDPGETDARRADPDFDCLNDAEEIFLGTNPFLADTDGDGLPDGLEAKGRLRFNAVTRTCNKVLCASVKGTAYETETCTDPKVRDSDGDGIVDGFEVINGYTTGEDLNADGCQQKGETNPCVADTPQPPIAGGDPACTLNPNVDCTPAQVGTCAACSSADMAGCAFCGDDGNDQCGGDTANGHCASPTTPCLPTAPCKVARQSAEALICADGNIKPVVLVRSIDNDYTLALPGKRGQFGVPDAAYAFQQLAYQGADVGHAFQNLDPITSPDTNPPTFVFGDIVRLGTLQVGANPVGNVACDAVTDNPPILDTVLAPPAQNACGPAQNYVVWSSSLAPSDVAQRGFLRIQAALGGAYTVTRTAGGNLAAHDDESGDGDPNASIISRAIDTYKISVPSGAVDTYQVKRAVAQALAGGNPLDNDLNPPASYAQGPTADLTIEFYRRVVTERAFAGDGSSTFIRVAEYGALFAVASLQQDCTLTTGASRLTCQQQVEPYTIAVDDLTNGTALGRFQANTGSGCDAYNPEKSKADFLMVLDDSGSMQRYILAIQSAVRSVAFQLDANQENLDWRIAMTTSNMGAGESHTSLLDEYQPLDTTSTPVPYPELLPLDAPPQQVALYQTTAYDAKGKPERCVYGDTYDPNNPLVSPYCCNYTGNSDADYYKACCSLPEDNTGGTLPQFYRNLKTAVTPNFDLSDLDGNNLFTDATPSCTTYSTKVSCQGAGCLWQGSASSGVCTIPQTNDTLRCWDFPRVGENHEMLFPTAFYPPSLGGALVPTQGARQRNFLDYLCGDSSGGASQRPLWGARGQLWPPGFQGFNTNTRLDGANLLVRNADMMVTQMNRDCSDTTGSDIGTSSIRARNGSGEEHGLQGAKRALERATAGGRTDPLAPNAYKLRQGTPVITLILSDEDDYAEKFKNNDRASGAVDLSARDHNQLPPAVCLFNGDTGCTVAYCEDKCFAGDFDLGDPTGQPSPAGLGIASARQFLAGDVVHTTSGGYCVGPTTADETDPVCSVLAGPVCGGGSTDRFDGFSSIPAGANENWCEGDDCSVTFTAPLTHRHDGEPGRRTPTKPFRPTAKPATCSTSRKTPPASAPRPAAPTVCPARASFAKKFTPTSSVACAAGRTASRRRPMTFAVIRGRCRPTG